MSVLVHLDLEECVARIRRKKKGLAQLREEVWAVEMSRVGIGVRGVTVVLHLGGQQRAKGCGGRRKVSVGGGRKFGASSGDIVLGAARRFLKPEDGEVICEEECTSGAWV